MGPLVCRGQKWILATMKSGYRATVSRGTRSAFLHDVGGLEESIPVHKEPVMSLARQGYIEVEKEGETGTDYVIATDREDCRS